MTTAPSSFVAPAPGPNRVLRPGWVAPLVAFAAAWLAFDLLVFAYGDSPLALLGLLVRGTWGAPAGIGQVLFKAAPLLFTGVAVDLALRAGLFNIGAEGQLAVASLAVGTVGVHLSTGLPAPLAWLLLTLVALLAGGLWAAIPAILRARFGAHEVISTLLMNRIADILVGALLARGLALEGTVRTPEMPQNTRLPRLSSLPGLHALQGTAANVSLLFAVLLVLLAGPMYKRTRFGRELALVGKNPIACAAERMPVPRRLGQALIASGALAGLASLATVPGYKGYFEQSLGAGAGFGGLAVALLGRGRASGMLLAALLFATLEQGGLALNTRVPMELSTVLEAVVIAAIALAEPDRLRALVGSSASTAKGAAS